jgi:hypothetical protein
MRLEKKRDAELARRQGSAKRTVIQFIWLAISIAIAYFLCTLVILNPDGGLLTYNEVYRALSLSRADIPEWAILGAFMFIIVFVMQFFLFIGFFLSSSEGRRRPGTPSLHSRNKDPLDNRFD